MSDHHVPLQHCINCGRNLDGASNLEGPDGPKIGSISVCLHCGHVMEFGIGMVLIRASDQTLLDIAGNKEFLRVMEIIKLFKTWKEKKLCR